jgi:hypothetical protein
MLLTIFSNARTSLFDVHRTPLRLCPRDMLRCLRIRCSALSGFGQAYLRLLVDGEPSPSMPWSSAYLRPCPEPMTRMCTCVLIARYRAARFSAEQAWHASKARRSGDGQTRQLLSMLCGLVCLVRRQSRVSLRVSSDSATVALSTVSIGGRRTFS